MGNTAPLAAMWVKEIKALDVATQLEMKEASYTKYERGETAISIDFIQKVADILEINPLAIIATAPGNFLQSITNSQIAIQDNSTFQTTNEIQTTLLLKLLENVTIVNERLINYMDK